MKKIDKDVVKETRYIAAWELILSLLLQSVFLIIGKWNYTVLLGNLLSGGIGIINFLLMGLTVQNAVNKDQKDAATAMKASLALRTFILFAASAVGVLLPFFDTWAVLIVLFFPRIAIAFRPVFEKNK